MFRLRLVFFKRIFLPDLNKIILIVCQTGSIIILFRQQIRMESGITGHSAVAITPGCLPHKSGIIPMHIEITVIDDAGFLRINIMLRKQLPVSTQHIIYWTLLHPILYRHDLSFRRKCQQSLRHRRITLQMFSTANKNNSNFRRIHFFHDPFYHRSSHYLNKRF